MSSTQAPNSPVTSTTRQALFARFWRLASGPVNRTLAATKHGLFTEMPASILEIGPGIGANFEYYPAGATVLAFEPNPGMHPRLRAAADEHGLDLELHPVDLRNAGLEPDSVDIAVSTLVLCSVDEPDSLVAEIRRVLRPGAALLFIEHVAPQPGTTAESIAKVIRRPWAWLGDDCNVLAQTTTVVENAGFAWIDARAEAFGGRFDPSSQHYWGRAVK